MSIEVSPTVRLIGSATKVTASGGPGVNSTVVVATLESTVAVIVATPGSSEVKVATAIPSAVVFVTVRLPKLPRLVSKSTDVPSATLLSY